MSMLAVGRDWARASPDQRQAVVAAFRSLLVRTYANALALYKDHKIERGGFDGLIRRLNSKGTAADAMKSPNTGQQNDR
jgi:hypothetical protein